MLIDIPMVRAPPMLVQVARWQDPMTGIPGWTSAQAAGAGST
jgi:hypothetical protein